jgi:hypothetical protein
MDVKSSVLSEGAKVWSITPNNTINIAINLAQSGIREFCELLESKDLFMVDLVYQSLKLNPLWTANLHKWRN